MEDLVIGDDGNARCGWGVSTPDYVHYHDTEWGRPSTEDRTLYEKMCLEGFQSGLSWLTILRKRDNFRAAFDHFDARLVADYGETEIDRLLDDAGIVRHRGKIEATINNAQALCRLWDDNRTLGGVIWSHEPPRGSRPATMGHVPASTPPSTALAKELKSLGFRFVGPTTAYAAMQAMGVVNDHIEGCWVAAECESERERATTPTR